MRANHCLQVTRGPALAFVFAPLARVPEAKRSPIDSEDPLRIA
jgi:hypothetical protein